MKKNKNGKLFIMILVLLAFSFNLSLANGTDLLEAKNEEGITGEDSIYGIDKIINKVRIKREEFRQKLDWTNSNSSKTSSSIVGFNKIKDEEKKEAVLKIINNIKELNIKYIETLSLGVNKIEDILAKVEHKVCELNENLDLDEKTFFLEIKLSEMGERINLLRDRMIEQAKNQYILIINSEDSLREDVLTIRNSFEEKINDLFLSSKNLKTELRSLVLMLGQEYQEYIEDGEENQTKEEAEEIISFLDKE